MARVSLKIGQKIMLLASIVVLFTASILGGYIYWLVIVQADSDVKQFEETTLDIKKRQLKCYSQIAFSAFDKASRELQERTREKLVLNSELLFEIIWAHYNAAMESSNPEEAQEVAKKELLDILEHTIFGGSGYFWVHQYDPENVGMPVMIMHPTIPSLNNTCIADAKYLAGPKKGQVIYALEIEEKVPFFIQMNRLINMYGEGFVDYEWPKLTTNGLTEYQPKSSYVKLFQPWGWVIGSGAYIKDIEPEVKERILEIVKEFRYGAERQGYLWIHSFDPENVDEVNMIMHPIIPELEGEDMSTFCYMSGPKKGTVITCTDPVNDVPFLVQINRMIAMSGDGYVTYDWPKPVGRGISDYEPKMSYAKLFEEWNWVVGTGLYLNEIAEVKQIRKNVLKSQTSKLFGAITVVILGSIAASIMAIYFLSGNIVRPIRALVERINEYASGDRTLRELPMPDDEIGDISRAFSALREENIHILNNLEETVEKRTQELTISNEELKISRQKLEVQNKDLIEVQQLKDDIERITRHDLKTPLNAIIGFPDLIMGDNLTPEQEEAVKSIEESGFMMLDMINISLDLFKMERGMYAFEPEPIDLLPVIKRIERELVSILRTKQLSINIFVDQKEEQNKDQFIVQGESLLFYSVFANLMKNAAEASPMGGEILIRLKQDKKIKISIQNSGTVPTQMHRSFFDKYVTSGKSGGTGLGTYSAKLIVETMKGKIDLDTHLEGHTIIHIHLPSAL